MRILNKAKIDTTNAEHYSDSAFVFSVAEYAMEMDFFDKFDWIELDMKEVENSLVYPFTLVFYFMMWNFPVRSLLNASLRELIPQKKEQKASWSSGKVA